MCISHHSSLTRGQRTARHILATKYYVDCCLPFGLRSAPYIFNTYAEVLEWILREHGIHYIIHYLDDFLIARKPTSSDCEQALTHVLHICQQLGFPIAEGKIEGPATILVFLGTLTGYHEARNAPSRGQSSCTKSTAATMANNQENYEKRTSLPHWVPVFRSQNHSSREEKKSSTAAFCSYGQP